MLQIELESDDWILQLEGFLPPELIAQVPIEPRDRSRLFVLDRKGSRNQHSIFRQIGAFLNPGDLLVLNETRVLAARLYARKIPTGRRIELLLLHPVDSLTWEALVGGKGLVVGRRLQVEDGPDAEIRAVLTGARGLVEFAEPVESHLRKAGHVPLPPYIQTSLADPERYQTVYAQQAGSAAAPTAGLHFTQNLLVFHRKYIGTNPGILRNRFKLCYRSRWPGSRLYWRFDCCIF